VFRDDPHHRDAPAFVRDGSRRLDDYWMGVGKHCRPWKADRHRKAASKETMAHVRRWDARRRCRRTVAKRRLMGARPHRTDANRRPRDARRHCFCFRPHHRKTGRHCFRRHPRAVMRCLRPHSCHHRRRHLHVLRHRHRAPTPLRRQKTPQTPRPVPRLK
jgi:hypothetical protein